MTTPSLRFGGVRDITVKRWWRRYRQIIGCPYKIGTYKYPSTTNHAHVLITDEAKQYYERNHVVSNAAGFTSTELREIINDLTNNEGDLKKRDIALVRRVKEALDAGTAISHDMADQLHEVWMRLC